MRFFFLLCALWFALMGGFFFAFSAAVMPGLALMPKDSGMLAMQSINGAVTNAYFAVGFWGAMAFSVLGLIVSFVLRPKGWFWTFLASLIYLIGAFLTTVWGNVPANRGIADLSPTSPAGLSAWTSFQPHWILLNDIRTAAAVLAAFLMLLPVIWAGGGSRR
ncbi:anthrone oxygenase family protein [Paracoccus aminophilus]|uniref:DUF1772 domain-containing protein n=1 Tax=Paracoccus aminophilus JCM 7686 TaxID=1367847 RepID=S5XSR7_PARAH|nr:anthrone oxygenase family protein [Paracoccus aminophilus]AGT10489.1 hypothetical protein JCM7686_3454 [Paracoccus aminophilus JCM 7686]